MNRKFKININKENAEWSDWSIGAKWTGAHFFANRYSIKTAQILWHP